MQIRPEYLNTLSVNKTVSHGNLGFNTACIQSLKFQVSGSRFKVLGLEFWVEV